MAVIRREDVDKKLTWDLTDLFKTEEEYEKAVEDLVALSKELEEEFKGRLRNSKTINACLDKLRSTQEKAVRVATFVNLNISADQTDTKAQERGMKFNNIASKYGSRLSFIDSEIIQADEGVIKEAMEASDENRGYLEEIIRKKRYALAPEVEEVLSSLSGTLGLPYELYNKAKLADMDFGSFEVDGKEYPLSFINFEGEWE